MTSITLVMQLHTAGQHSVLNAVKGSMHAACMGVLRAELGMWDHMGKQPARLIMACVPHIHNQHILLF